MACHFETTPRGRERASAKAGTAPTVYVVGEAAASRERLAALAAAAREERARHARPHRYRALFRELDRLLADDPR